jgi:competence protein ComEC
MGKVEAKDENRHREADAWLSGLSFDSLPTTPAATKPPIVSPVARNRRFFRLIPNKSNLSAFDTAISHALLQEREHGHFFLFIPVFMGIGAAIWYALATEPSPIAIVLLYFAATVPAMRFRHDARLATLLAGAAALVPLGMLLAALESHRLSTVILDTPVTTHVTGRVLSRESDERGRMRYRVQLTQTRDPVLRRSPTTITLLARSRHEPAAIGALISGRARLSSPSGPALSGLNDFAFDAYFSGTGAVGFFYGKPAVHSAPDEDVAVYARLKQRIATWRNGLTEHIRGRIDGDAGAIAAALVTAEQRAISPQTVEALRQAGLAHVLAISGLNMVLAAGTFLIGARMALALIPGFSERYPAKKLAAAGALVMVTLYILVSGGAISAVRSWIMICVMLVAVLFGRNAISLRNIALSAILILAVTPSAVTGPGFQMSYAATLGLVAGYAAWRERPVRHETPAGPLSVFGGSLGRFFGGLLLSSLIGGFATLIYSVGHFHRIPAYGLIGNLLAMPVISIIVMPFGLIAMLFMPFGLDAIPFAIMGKGIEWMIAMSNWVSGWGGEVVTGRIDAMAFLFISLGGGILCLLRTWLRHLGTILVTLGCVIAFTGGGQSPPEVIVSEDGRLVAIVAGETAATNRERPPGFVYDQWRRALRLTIHTKPIMHRSGGDGETRKVDTGEKPAVSSDKSGKGTANGKVRRVIDGKEVRSAMVELLHDTGRKEFACRSREWCAAVSPSGWRIITIEDPAYLGAACDSADLVIAPQHLRTARCRSGADLITARSLRKTGALEIRPGRTLAGNTFRFEITPAVNALERSWAMHRLYDWRTGRFDGEDAPVSGSVE